MKTIRIFSTNYSFIEQLSNELKKSNKIMLLPPANNEHDLLQQVLCEPPQMMVLDLSHASESSAGVYEIFKRIPLAERPVIIAAGNKMIPEIFKYIRNELVQMFVSPYDIKAVAHWVEVFADYTLPSNGLNCMTHEAVDRLASNCLRELGISPHLMGYHTLREAVKIVACMRSGARIQVVKHIYQTVADMFNSNPSAVEHSMRHAIDTAWTRADINTLQSYFGYTFNATRDTPSNSQFIFMVAERIRATFATEFIPENQEKTLKI